MKNKYTISLTFLSILLINFSLIAQFPHEFLDFGPEKLFSIHDGNLIHSIDSIHYKTFDTHDKITNFKRIIIKSKDSNQNITSAIIYPYSNSLLYSYNISTSYFDKNTFDKYLYLEKRENNYQDTLYYFENYPNGKIKLKQLKYIERCGNGSGSHYNKQMFSYDNNFNIIERKDYFKYGNNKPDTKWELEKIINYSYNSQNKIKVIKIQKPDPTSGNLINFSKETKSYFNGFLTSTLNQNWNNKNNTWINNYKYDFVNIDNKKIKVISLWQNDNQNWVPNSKYIDTEDNLKKVSIYQSWNKIKGVWKNVFRRTYSKTGIRDFENFENEIWDESNGIWTLYSSKLYSINGDTIINIEAIKGHDNYKKLITFAENDKVKSIIKYRNIDDNWKFSNETAKSYNQYENISKSIFKTKYSKKETEYFYSTDLASGIPETQDNDFTVFPNPSNGIFTIKFDNSNQLPKFISIYDIQGKKVFSTSKIGSEFMINLEKVNTGIYFLDIKGEEIQKIIVK